MYTSYDDVMTWGQFPQFSPSETGGMPSQSQVAIDYKCDDARAVLSWVLNS